MAETEIDLWVTRLDQENMPTFSRTVELVVEMAARDDSPLSELAWSILQDPTLTTKVLKMANSVYFNPSLKRINTVSRAVMRLGSDRVKEICLTISLIETVLSSLHKDKVALEVARSFHAAVQARRLVIRLNLPGSEEVFIAALLTRIGNIAFWCFAGEDGHKLENAMLDSESEELAELKVLGFKLERLTARLSQEWRLSDLLESALQKRKGTDPLVRSIKLGNAVAQASESGWNSPQVKRIIKEVGDFLRLPEKETIETLHESALAAAEVTESFGTKTISRYIPIPGEASPDLSVLAEVNKIGDETSQPCASKSGRPVSSPEERHSQLPHEAVIRQEYPKPDSAIQMSSLRDLWSLVMSRRGDINMVLSIILEGIYRGVGMDRVLFALLTPDRQQLKGKYGLGWTDEGFVERFKISASSEMFNIFGHLLKSGKPIWVSETPDSIIKSLLIRELSDLTQGGPFFAMPIAIKSVPIGVIYADRNQSNRRLDEESFENFSFYGQQANMSLSALDGG